MLEIVAVESGHDACPKTEDFGQAAQGVAIGEGVAVFKGLGVEFGGVAPKQSGGLAILLIHDENSKLGQDSSYNEKSLPAHNEGLFALNARLLANDDTRGH